MKTVIFDFDGVILDSFPNQYEWFRYISNKLNKSFPYKTIEEFREIYKEPVYPNLYTFLGFDWDKEKDVIWTEFINFKTKSEIPIFDGISKTISELNKSGYKIGIASINLKDSITKTLEENQLLDFFDVIVGKEDLPIINGEPALKPNPAAMNIALEKLNCKPENATYIGDQPTDVLAAQRSNVKSIAVTYGYSNIENIKKVNPDNIVDNPKKLLETIINHYSL